MRDALKAVKGHPSGVLLAAQLLEVLAYPFAGDTPLGRSSSASSASSCSPSRCMPSGPRPR